MTVYDLRRQPGGATGSWAWLSDDLAYRYRLGRRWDADGPCDVWIMLNPSTADAETNDPTIRRCIGFSRAGGAGAIVVVNLFALRSTDPSALLTHPDPIGPANDDNIAGVTGRAVEDGARVVAAWGAHPMAEHRAHAVRRVVHEHGAELLCLGTTKRGAPRHPLYVPGNAIPTPWSPR